MCLFSPGFHIVFLVPRIHYSFFSSSLLQSVDWEAREFIDLLVASAHKQFQPLEVGQENNTLSDDHYRNVSGNAQ